MGEIILLSLELLRFLIQENEFDLNPGKYLSLLSHSGSRGFGAKIANHYTKLAMKLCKLPDKARHLAWLDLDTEAGQEYWLAMNLAGGIRFRQSSPDS